MIKTLTPYYVSIPLVNPLTDLVCDSYTIKLFIWAGNKNAVPSTPEYEITKVNAAASNGTEKVNISRIINDFIDFNVEPSLVTSLENSDNQVWVNFYVLYSDQPTLPQLQFVQLAVKGYGYFTEGENPDTPSNKILINIEDYKVNRNGFFVLPIELDETPPPTPELVITDVQIVDNFFEIYFTQIGTYPQITVFVDEEFTFSSFYPFDAPTSPILLEFIPPVVETDFVFTLEGFDIISNTNVQSNSFLITFTP